VWDACALDCAPWVELTDSTRITDVAFGPRGELAVVLWRGMVRALLQLLTVPCAAVSRDSTLHSTVECVQAATPPTRCRWERCHDRAPLGSARAYTIRRTCVSPPQVLVYEERKELAYSLEAELGCVVINK
jgi:hypothetical protein